MAKINLRIVGLYFNEEVNIPLKKGLTVKDVVDEYIKDKGNSSVVGGLSYTPNPYTTGSSVISFTHNFSGSFNYDGLPGISLVDGPTLGKRKRKAGVYTLSEETLKTELAEEKIFLTWQYYVVSKGGKVKSKTPSSRKFTRWGNPPDYKFKDGDSVIWRLVAVYDAPYQK